MRIELDTAAGIDAATFRLGTEWFGIDVLQVQEVMTPMPLTPVPLAPPYVRGLINVRGVIVTSISLKTRLGFPDVSYGDEHHNIIVHTPAGPVCLCVDEIGDVIHAEQLAVADKPTTVASECQRFIKGVIKMDDRLVSFLHVDLLAGS